MFPNWHLVYLPTCCPQRIIHIRYRNIDRRRSIEDTPGRRKVYPHTDLLTQPPRFSGLLAISAKGFAFVDRLAYRVSSVLLITIREFASPASTLPPLHIPPAPHKKNNSGKSSLFYEIFLNLASIWKNNTFPYHERQPDSALTSILRFCFGKNACKPVPCNKTDSTSKYCLQPIAYEH